jgi:hypothetical protein
VNERLRTGERERERERIDRSLRLLMLRARRAAGLTERENDRRGRGEREMERESDREYELLRSGCRSAGAQNETLIGARVRTDAAAQARGSARSCAACPGSSSVSRQTWR